MRTGSSSVVIIMMLVNLYGSTECYNNEVWRDWVMVNWEGDGLLPARIWGFVDL